MSNEPRKYGGGDWVKLEDYQALRKVAEDLLEALELADAVLRGANMNMVVVEAKVKAAIAKAKGES